MEEEIKKFIDIIRNIFPEIETKTSKIMLYVDFSKYELSKSYKIKFKHIRELLKKIKNDQVENKMVLYNRSSYEIPLRYRDSSHFSTLFLFRKSKEDSIFVEKKDSINKINYRIGLPSEESVLLFLTNSNYKDYKEFFGRVSWAIKERSLFTHIERHRKTGKDEHETKNKFPDFFDLLRALMPYKYSLRIESSSNRELNKFEELSESFLFNISYNTGEVFTKMGNFEELMPKRKIRHPIKNAIEEMEVPKKIYNPDLVRHYQMALYASSPLLKFISFYHILEYFFERIYKDDLLKNIKRKIIDPGFSYKRDKDLNELVNTVAQGMKIRGGDIAYNEEKALALILKKYVDIEDLKSGLGDELLQYYERKLPFVNGKTGINWGNTKSGNIIKNISKRIYKTRNAIVHTGKTTGEQGQKRYLPFKNEKDLSRELPLIKFISERVIIGSAKEI